MPSGCDRILPVGFQHVSHIALNTLHRVRGQRICFSQRPRSELRQGKAVCDLGQVLSLCCLHDCDTKVLLQSDASNVHGLRHEPDANASM